MNFQWAKGFHAPKGVNAADMAAALDKLKYPSPEGLYEASKAKRHVLNNEIWSEGDQVWATRGRMERCRTIIGAVEEIIIVGGKSLSIRAVEFIPVKGEGRWTRVEEIRDDPVLCDAYLATVIRMQEQATAKLARVRELLKAK